MATHVILLAAGRGTRMDSDLPKVLHEIGHAPLFVHALASAREIDPERTVIVVGHEGDMVAAAAERHASGTIVARQDRQRGTAHAVAAACGALEGAEGDVFVLYGDTPFIRPETLEAMATRRAEGADIVILGFDAVDPGRYGRLVMEGDRLERIVEFKDASPEERAITLCNSGVLVADRAVLFDLVDAVTDDNEAGEFYLTDIVGIARARGLTTAAVFCHEAETLGINTRAELVAAEAQFQIGARIAAMKNGAQFLAPDTVFLSYDTYLGRDAVIEQNVVFGPGVTVETGARIRAFSHVEGAHVGRGALIGPYARLRPGAEIGNDARIGNFVEVKASEIGEGAKINHLSYIGDASVGAAANIGAGAVTCNYDGVSKHRTEIGDRAFIGSDTMLVAPVRVGVDAMTASGSVVTRDVPDGAMAVARARQVVKEGLARKMFDKLKAARKPKDQRAV